MDQDFQLDPNWQISAKQAKHILQVGERLGVTQEEAILGCGIEKKWCGKSGCLLHASRFIRSGCR